MPLVRSHSPYTEAEWHQIDALGQNVEGRLQALGVGLTMGGEPTFISCEDFKSPQWCTAALGADKYRIATQLLLRLQRRFVSAGALLHDGLGKLYPGEELPRWALGCYWRQDGNPLWQNPELRAETGRDYGHTQATADAFTHALIEQLGIGEVGLLPALDSAGEEWGGYVVPLLPLLHRGKLRWGTCRWQLSDGSQVLRLLRGESQIGLRLPLTAIAWPDTLLEEADADLHAPSITIEDPPLEFPPNSICVALGIEIRTGTLRIFLPPLSSARGYVDLLGAIEATAAIAKIPVAIEGYPPPTTTGLSGFQITPDPGVVEVNIHPANNWSDLVVQTEILFEVASHCGLGMEKFTLDGRRISTGGGAHITIGGRTPQDSPLLRRPDLLRSLLAYWQNHPSLSYLFAGMFVGSSSQAPRLDEARRETLYELDIALNAIRPGEHLPPEVVDCLLGNLLVDASGNAHRTALCIDKLYPIRNPQLQWGLLEFRGFSMPPDERMRLLQLLLVRALVAKFWQQPYTERLNRWGSALHDRFLLPHYLRQDLQRVLADLQQAGFEFATEWFEPFVEFRFPIYGEVMLEDGEGRSMQLELRHAIEPWNVIDGDANDGGTSRMVDASLERIQVTVRAAPRERANCDVLCNHYCIPMVETENGQWVGGVRFRARQVTSVNHPAVAPHRRLVFEAIDRQTGRSLGGCTYFPDSPDGSGYSDLPATAAEAGDRMAERFIPQGAKSETVPCHKAPISPEYPSLLDLRSVADPH